MFSPNSKNKAVNSQIKKFNTSENSEAKLSAFSSIGRLTHQDDAELGALFAQKFPHVCHAVIDRKKKQIEITMSSLVADISTDKLIEAFVSLSKHFVTEVHKNPNLPLKEVKGTLDEIHRNDLLKSLHIMDDRRPDTHLLHSRSFSR